MLQTQLISGFIGLVLTLFLVPCARDLACRYRVMLDRPSGRRIHTKPVPRVGGISIAVAFLIAVLPFNNSFPPRLMWGILAAGIIGMCIGIRDDIKGMNASQKFIGQAVIALVLISSGLRIERMVLPFFPNISLPWPFSFLTTLFWVAATMNAVNLIDGMDGCAAGLLLIATVGISIISMRSDNALAGLMAVALVGTCLGFLRYNFHPASIFMGDGGSMFFGAVFAGLSLLLTRNGTTTGSLWIPVTLLAIPFLDTTLTIIRRIQNKRSLFSADRGHLHHQLFDWGLNQRQVAFIFYLLSALMAGLAVTCFQWTDVRAMEVITVAGVLLLGGGLVMRHLHRKRFLSNVAKIEEKAVD
jgi:UDP-GlcNAc:undecaprenyl-phosphate/decaprenyl-phosphate GlcNAc-1-phosphate transferase